MGSGPGCGCSWLFAYPIAFIRWCFENGWKGYITLIITLIFLIIMFFVGRSCVTNYFSSDPGIEGAPTKIEAPYQINTYSRIYYAESVTVDEATGDVTMINFWEVLDNTWVKHEVEFVLEAAAFGDIDINER